MTGISIIPDDTHGGRWAHARKVMDAIAFLTDSAGGLRVELLDAAKSAVGEMGLLSTTPRTPTSRPNSGTLVSSRPHPGGLTHPPPQVVSPSSRPSSRSRPDSARFRSLPNSAALRREDAHRFVPSGDPPAPAEDRYNFAPLEVGGGGVLSWGAGGWGGGVSQGRPGSAVSSLPHLLERQLARMGASDYETTNPPSHM